MIEKYSSQVLPMMDDPTPFPPQTPVGMAYIPYQNMDRIYDEEQGLMVGTLFPELNKPFLGGKH